MIYTLLINFLCLLFINPIFADIFEEFSQSQRELPKKVIELVLTKNATSKAKKASTKKSSTLSPSEFFLDSLLSQTFSQESFEFFCQTIEKDAFDTSEKGCLSNQDLLTALPRIKIPLLHLLVLLGTEEKVFAFLKSRQFTRAQINTSVLGWTIGHFFALKDNDYSSLLRELNVDLSLKNKFDGTADDVWNISHLLPLSEISVPLRLNKKDGIVLKTAEEFKKERGTILVERAKIRATNFFQLFWDELHQLYSEETKFEITSTSNYMMKKIREKNPTYKGYQDLFLEPLNDQSPEQNTHNLGFTLTANKKFSSYELVTIYEGERVPWGSLPKDETYSMQHTDGTDMRGFASFAKDCLPNAYTLYFFDYKGYPCLDVIVAIRPIKKG